MSLITIKNLWHKFGDKPIFKNAEFVLNNGDKIGIVGLNGAGKSTFIKILQGEVLPDKIDVKINPKTKIGSLDQHAEINYDLSIREYLHLAFKHLYDIEEKLNNVNAQLSEEADANNLTKLLEKSDKFLNQLIDNNFYELDTEIEKVAYGLGLKAIGLERNVKTLSGGQRAKVMLAKLLLDSPDILLLDEPTNFLDTSHIEWLTKYLFEFKGSFITISHDRPFLTGVANCIYDVDNYKIIRYNMTFAGFLKAKELKAEQYEKEYGAQRKKIAKLEDYVARNMARASTSNMAKSRQKALNKITRLDKPQKVAKPTINFAYKQMGSRVALKVFNLEVGYNGKALLPPVSLEILSGEVLAIKGFNGIGKSTFLKTLAGIIPKVSGEFEFATNTIIGYYEQDNNFENTNQTPLEFIREEFHPIEEKLARTMLFKCGLNGKHITQSFKNLSGGEQSKAKLCYLTLFNSNVLVLDEPTNHLDVNAIASLKKAIKNFNGSVIVVSHDEAFIESVADKVLNMEELFN